jgi:hypothetical protein
MRYRLPKFGVCCVTSARSGFCAHRNDVAIVSLIEVWIGETERRTGFLAEIIHDIERPQTL